MPGLTMQVQAAQVQTQESAGSATATYNGKTFNRASAAYQDGDVSYEGMPLYNGNAEDLDDYVNLIMDEIGVDGWISILAGKSPVGTYADEEWERAKTYNVPGLPVKPCGTDSRVWMERHSGRTSWHRHRHGIQIC